MKFVLSFLEIIYSVNFKELSSKAISKFGLTEYANAFKFLSNFSFL